MFVYGAGLPIEQMRRRRGVAISGNELGIEVIATWSSFCVGGVGDFFRCLRDFLVERLRDERLVESGISSLG